MAGRYDMKINQGSTFSLLIRIRKFDGTYMDLTDWTPSGKVRKHYRSTNVTATFTFDKTNASTGWLTIQLSAAVTAGIIAGESDTDSRGQYVYDIEVKQDSGASPTNEVKRLLQGNVIVSPEVTR
jgi:hypothetical protein